MMATQVRIATLLVLIYFCIVQASMQAECTLRTNGLALLDSRYYGQPTICNGRCVLKQENKIPGQVGQVGGIVGETEIIGKDPTYETIIYNCLIVTIPTHGTFKRCETSIGITMILLAK